MSARPRKKSAPKVTKDILVGALDVAERRLTILIGRWGNGVPAAIRVELHEIHEPLLNLLLLIGRR